MSKEPNAVTNYIRSLTYRLSKLENEVKRQRDEFDAIKLTEKAGSESTIAKARSSKNRTGDRSSKQMAEVPKRPISMFTEDKREKERPLTPVQENDAASSIVENGALKPVIKDLIAVQIAEALKEPNPNLEQYQGTKTEKIANLADQVASLRDDSVNN